MESHLLLSHLHHPPRTPHLQVQPANHHLVHFPRRIVHSGSTLQLDLWRLPQRVHHLRYLLKWTDEGNPLDFLPLPRFYPGHFCPGSSLPNGVLLLLLSKLQRQQNDTTYVSYLPESVENQLDYIHEQVGKLIYQPKPEEEGKNDEYQIMTEM